MTSEENEEIKRLKAENRRLREDVAILKAATIFFVGELDPPQPLIVAFIDECFVVDCRNCSDLRNLWNCSA